MERFDLPYIGRTGDVGVYRFDLAAAKTSQITSITIFDDRIISGGDGRASGFDLDFIAISPFGTQSPSTAAGLLADSRALDTFDYQNGVTFTAGFQTPATRSAWEGPDLFGTSAGDRYEPSLATLGRFDGENDNPIGSLSLGEGGAVTFVLKRPVPTDDLILYIGDVGGGNDKGFVAFNLQAGSVGVDLIGTSGDDTILLGEGDNSGSGAGDDRVDGVAGNDTISTAAGNDILTGGPDDDTLRGGDGNDTAVYSGQGADYRVILIDGEVRRVEGPEGTDMLDSIERVQFSDTTLAFDTGRGEFAGQAYRIYNAAFDRTPDKAGVSFWTNALDEGTSLVDVAKGFLASEEFAQAYGQSATNEEFVGRLYTNILNREAEAAGRTFWQDALNGGSATRADVLALFSESNENVDQIAPVLVTGVSLDTQALVDTPVG